jgi:hypothetical protein
MLVCVCGQDNALASILLGIIAGAKFSLGPWITWYHAKSSNGMILLQGLRLT